MVTLEEIAKQIQDASGDNSDVRQLALTQLSTSVEDVLNSRDALKAKLVDSEAQIKNLRELNSQYANLATLSSKPKEVEKKFDYFDNFI